MIPRQKCDSKDNKINVYVMQLEYMQLRYIYMSLILGTTRLDSIREGCFHSVKYCISAVSMALQSRLALP